MRSSWRQSVTDPITADFEPPVNTPEASGESPSVLPIDSLRVEDGATISPSADGRGVSLVTAPVRWSHAAYLPFALPDIDRVSRVVEVAIEVLRGEIGVGWAIREEKRWVARRGVAKGIYFIRLIVPAGTVGGDLVFDNWTSYGSAHAVIEAISVLPKRLTVGDVS